MVHENNKLSTVSSNKIEVYVCHLAKCHSYSKI